jgi:hypothetical protein
MAESKKTPAAGAESQADKSFSVSLDEFCARLSASDGRVEMISGFHYSERKAGHLNDTSVAFKKRYEAFADQPVK